MFIPQCLFLNDYSIHDHLDTIPLHPLVALGAFLTAQKVSILDHDQRDDPIIQQLYGISKHVFEHVTTREKTTVVDLLGLCDNTQSKFQKCKEILEDLPNNNLKKRAIDCLNDGLNIVKSYKTKYMSDQSSSSTASSPAASSPALITAAPSSSLPVLSSLTDPSTSTITQTTTRTPASSSSSSENWTFVGDYIRNLGSNKMNWKACYLKGQRQGYFANYTTPVSLKNAYQRWKANNDETEE
ncbi:hypothetical protein MFLAVUS_002641 [Mucor flavus]|uniref:Uncharacterized protein n=1 Tax=Mucor flavus TaxID=439312 RepID=A0ABP9YQW3_9FUNG